MIDDDQFVVEFIGLDTVGVFFKQRVALEVHPASACAGAGCVIHGPSHHAMREWPIAWFPDIKCMRRLCVHNKSHPDPDDVAYHALFGADVTEHVCDGCCVVVAGEVG